MKETVRENDRGREIKTTKIRRLCRIKNSQTEKKRKNESISTHGE